VATGQTSGKDYFISDKQLFGKGVSKILGYYFKNNFPNHCCLIIRGKFQPNFKLHVLLQITHHFNHNIKFLSVINFYRLAAKI